MSKSMKPVDLVTIEGEDLWTTSIKIAEVYGRPHRSVVRDLRKLIAEAAFTEHTVVLSDYRDSTGRGLPMYMLREEAFLIAMPFLGGREALQGQKRLVDAFMRMRRELRRRDRLQRDPEWQHQRLSGKGVRREWADTVQRFVEYAKAQGSQNAERYYQNITRMEYAALELVKRASSQGFRDSLSLLHLTQLSAVEFACQEALRQGMADGLQYKDIYAKAREVCTAFASQLRRYMPLPAGSVSAVGHGMLH